MSKKFTPGKAGASKTIQQKLASKAKGRGEKLKPLKKKGPLKESSDEDKPKLDPAKYYVTKISFKGPGKFQGEIHTVRHDVGPFDTKDEAEKACEGDFQQSWLGSDLLADPEDIIYEDGGSTVTINGMDCALQDSEELKEFIDDLTSRGIIYKEGEKEGPSGWPLFSVTGTRNAIIEWMQDVYHMDESEEEIIDMYPELASAVSEANEEEGDTENPDASKEGEDNEDQSGEEEEEESDVDVIDINPEAFYVKLESEETLKLIGPFDSEDEASAYMKENEIPEDSAEVVQGLGSDDEEASDDNEGDEQGDEQEDEEGDEEESDNGVPKNLPGLDINPLEDIITKPPHEDEEELDEDEDEEEDCDCNESYQSQLQTLVESDNTLTESFKKKAAVIFESAVATKVKEEKAKLKKNFDKHLTERVARVNQTLSDKIDSYLSYAVESWVESNKVAIDQSLRTEIAENFIDSLKGVFNEHYIEVPKAKVNVVTRLESKVTKLEESLQTTEKAKRSLASKVVRLEKEKVISEASKGLATTQSAKLQSLVEGVTFTSPEDFKKKVSVIRESHFANKRPSTTQRFADTKKQTVRTGSIYESTEIQESNQFAKTNDGDEVSSTIAQAAKILSLNENRS